MRFRARWRGRRLAIARSRGVWRSRRGCRAPWMRAWRSREGTRCVVPRRSAPRRGRAIKLNAISTSSITLTRAAAQARDGALSRDGGDQRVEQLGPVPRVAAEVRQLGGADYSVTPAPLCKAS